MTERYVIQYTTRFELGLVIISRSIASRAVKVGF